MKTNVCIAAFMLFAFSGLHAQNSGEMRLSLQECVKQAIEKNINVQNARIEKEKMQWKVSETRSTLFPKINASGNFQNNLQLPTTILPGEIIGKPGTDVAVQMGANYSTIAAASLNQVLYNQTAFTALRLAKSLETLSDLGIEKASEELTNEVAKLYFLALTTAKQKTLVQDNITRIQRLQGITKLLVDNGMGKKVDFDRINVNLENLYTQLSNTEATQEQQLNMIKYILALPIQQVVVLTDTAEMPLLHQLPQASVDFSNHVDVQMLESQKEINVLNQKTINSGYVPTLSLVGQYSYQGLRSEFSNYFHSSSENHWYASSYVGLSLSIPIFDGFEKRAKSRQVKLDYKKTTIALDDTKARFGVDYQNAMNSYQNSKANVQRQKQNIDLAEKVYKETALKYREGLATLSDLLQDEMGLNNAQAGYLNALYSFKEAELKIMSLNGEIRGLMK